MRVIQVVPAVAHEASGPSYSVVRLAESLIAIGVETDLVALDWAPSKSTPPMLRAFRLGVGHPKLGRSPEMYRWIRARVRESSVDLIHSHVLWQFNSLYPSRAIRGSDVKLVASPRGSLSEWAFASGSKVKRPFWHLLQRRALECAHCLHATSWAEYEDIRRMGFRQPICVIPNGIDVPEPCSIEKEKQVLFLGRLHPNKGLLELLHCWKKLEKDFPEWSLSIVGPDSGYDERTDFSREVRKLAQGLDLKNVVFPGPAYGADKWLAYQRASVFILPSHSENFGLAVAEALAAGTPVIATTGTPWSGLEKKNAGWWIRLDDVNLSNALRDAMSRPAQELRAMGVNGRAWMQHEFSWGEVSRRMYQVYSWLCGQTDRPKIVHTN